MQRCMKRFTMTRPLHSNIIQFYTSFRDAYSICFVLELCIGGDLRLSYQLGEIYTEYKVAYVIYCIGSAINHLHYLGILHRDIKPENIMLTSDGVPKLIDFGVSYLNPPSHQKHICVCQYRSGTKEYLAPEVFVGGTHYHGYESDYWSLGVVMYEMLFKKRPYEDISLLKPLVKYSQDTYRSAWDSLVQHKSKFSRSQSSILLTSGHTTIATDQTDFEESPSNYLDLGSFLQNFDPSSSDPFEIIVPRENGANERTSTECKDLLIGLLDPRIHMRFGVGNRSRLFTAHSWFSSNGLCTPPLSSSWKTPSPLFSNVSIMGDQLQRGSGQTNSVVLVSPEIDEILTKDRVHYVSPTY
jgi:serine/threonine protein kinase